MSVLLLTAAAISFTPFHRFMGSHASRVASPVALSLLKAEGTPDAIDNLFSQAESAMGVVCLACTQPQHMVSNMVIARTAETYASSMLYGGPSCSVIECMLPAEAAVETGMIAERLSKNDGVELPLVAVYSKGSLAKVVAPTKLEETLLALGARSATASTNTASRDFGATSGGPSATAVDDIDFTGGAGNKGRPDWVPKFNDAGRTTRGFFPGSNLEENAGDYITREDGDGPIDRSRIVGDGKPGGNPNRKDKPPGAP